jgi:hypothetical protein
MSNDGIATDLERAVYNLERDSSNLSIDSDESRFAYAKFKALGHSVSMFF